MRQAVVMVTACRLTEVDFRLTHKLMALRIEELMEHLVPSS